MMEFQDLQKLKNHNALKPRHAITSLDRNKTSSFKTDLHVQQKQSDFAVQSAACTLKFLDDL